MLIDICLDEEINRDLLQLPKPSRPAMLPPGHRGGVRLGTEGVHRGRSEASDPVSGRATRMASSSDGLECAPLCTRLPQSLAVVALGHGRAAWVVRRGAARAKENLNRDPTRCRERLAAASVRSPISVFLSFLRMIR
jgi:hypothetical protein